jgi:hypothetical protein
VGGGGLCAVATVAEKTCCRPEYERLLLGCKEFMNRYIAIALDVWQQSVALTAGRKPSTHVVIVVDLDTVLKNVRSNIKRYTRSFASSFPKKRFSIVPVKKNS